eukprot:16641_4
MLWHISAIFASPMEVSARMGSIALFSCFDLPPSSSTPSATMVTYCATSGSRANSLTFCWMMPPIGDSIETIFSNTCLTFYS